MCELEPVGQLNVDSWGEMVTWLAASFETIGVGDIFDLGPYSYVRSLAGHDEDEADVPCAQVLRLDGAALLRLSTKPMGAPLLRTLNTTDITFDVWHRRSRFEDHCTFGWLVSNDWELMADTCVNWFRDKHRMKLHHIGCNAHFAGSLGGPRGIPPSERY